MTQPISGVSAALVTLNPLFNGKSDLQSALVSMIPIVDQYAVVDTTDSVTPVSYRLWNFTVPDAGTYKITSWTVIGSTSNNTVVDLEFKVNGVANPVTWNEQPVTGDQFAMAQAFFPLTAGANTLEILFARLSGAGLARASGNIFVVTRSDFTT